MVIVDDISTLLARIDVAFVCLFEFELKRDI